MPSFLASQALKHRFIAEGYHRSSPGVASIDHVLVGKLRRFAAAPAMRRLAVLIEAHLLGPEDDEDIRKQVGQRKLSTLVSPLRANALLPSASGCWRPVRMSSRAS